MHRPFGRERIRFGRGRSAALPRKQRTERDASQTQPGLLEEMPPGLGQCALKTEVLRLAG
jgi:hypothetical protein